MQCTDELLLSILESVAAGVTQYQAMWICSRSGSLTCLHIVFKVSDESLDIATDVEPSGLRETGKPPMAWN